MPTQVLPEQPVHTEPVAPPPAKAKHPLRLALFIGLGVLAAVAAGLYYLHSRHFESTDNAFVEGSVTQVGPRVSGQVLRVFVHDNQHVNRGDPIAELDARGFEAVAEEAQGHLADIVARAGGAQSSLQLTSTVTTAVLAQADAGAGAAQEQVHVLEAGIARATAEIRMAEADVRQAEARESAARAEAARADLDAVRYRALHEKDEISTQRMDLAETQARSARAALDAAGQVTEAARARLAQAHAAQLATDASFRQAQKQLAQARGKVNEAGSAPQQMQMQRADIASFKAQTEEQRAAVRQAELNLSYTRINAPESGYITHKAVEPGDFVQAGQTLLALVSDRLWVVANFKETQLTHMRPGQPVTLKLDAYPKLRLRGHVESVQSGTGAYFSLLPSENATGNYVKVVQRVPVKIVLDEELPAGYRIGPGMSVDPEVRVQ